MTTTLEKITKKAKQLRKLHPNTPYVELQRKAAAMVSGVKKKPAKRKVGNIKMIAGTKKKAAPRAKAVGKVSRATPHKDHYAKGKAILRKIEKMEGDLKKATGREAKDFIRRAINKQHDLLDALTR